MVEKPISSVESAVRYLTATGEDPALAKRVITDLVSTYGAAAVVEALEVERRRSAEVLHRAPPADNGWVHAGRRRHSKEETTMTDIASYRPRKPIRAHMPDEDVKWLCRQAFGLEDTALIDLEIVRRIAREINQQDRCSKLEAKKIRRAERERELGEQLGRRNERIRQENEALGFIEEVRPDGGRLVGYLEGFQLYPTRSRNKRPGKARRKP